jgi:flagellar hook assembly protein FlgD
VANVLVFDAAGRLVRQLVRNNLLSLNGTWKWDGLGDKQNKLPVGTYIVFTEIFNTDGKRKSFKNTVVLARQLN